MGVNNWWHSTSILLITMQCNELHALKIRAITIAQNCWPALGHRLNRIMVALGHNHNHSGMQSCTCSVMDITHRRIINTSDKYEWMCALLCAMTSIQLIYFDPQTHYQGSTLSSLYGVHRELHMMSWLVQEGPLKLGPNAIHQAPTCHAHHRAKHSPQSSLGSHQWASISAMCVHLFLGTSTSKNTAIQFHKFR